MPHSNIIEGQSEDEIWKVLAEQLNGEDHKNDYTAQFSTEKHCVTLHVDIHPDTVGEEGGPVTSFTAPLPDETTFRFRIIKQKIKHDIGKLFGVQDVIVGHREFDDKFLIQTNDEAKVKELLSKPEVSEALLKQEVIDFEIREHKIGAHKETVLGLEIEGGITEPGELKAIYQPFKTVLSQLD
jgi:hypothetical protein